MRRFINGSPRLLTVCILLLGLAGIAFLALYPRSKKEESLRDKYKLLEFGMTEKEVFEILGSPTTVRRWNGMGGPESECFWSEGGTTIGVNFRERDSLNLPIGTFTLQWKRCQRDEWWKQHWEKLKGIF
jgi:hypothetical protein